MHLTYVMLEKQVKDLRVRISNILAKEELAKQESDNIIASLKNEMGEMPEQIHMLQNYISQCERKIDEQRVEIDSLKKENRALVFCKVYNFGYKRFSFIRASSVVNRQSTDSFDEFLEQVHALT